MGEGGGQEEEEEEGADADSASFQLQRAAIAIPVNDVLLLLPPPCNAGNLLWLLAVSLCALFPSSTTNFNPWYVANFIGDI